jgi:AraC-like DNA-binding protein
VVLHAPGNAAWFSIDVWNRPLPRRDEALRRTLRRHADLVLATHPAGGDSMADRVRAELLQLATVGLPSIDDIARRLATSPRSLQRRLRDEGVTFADLVRRTREDLARRYLKDPGLTVTEVAYLLGFSEASAFSRAFRAWTGRTPGEFRTDPAR